MSKSRWLVVALICSLVATPTISNAQAPDSTRDRLKEHADDFVHDVLRSLLRPNWNVFVHGGFTTTDRFLLQRRQSDRWPAGAGEFDRRQLRRSERA